MTTLKQAGARGEMVSREVDKLLQKEGITAAADQIYVSCIYLGPEDVARALTANGLWQRYVEQHTKAINNSLTKTGRKESWRSDVQVVYHIHSQTYASFVVLVVV